MKRLKQRQFYVLKFSSNRLKEFNYNINITLEQARKNNELIAIADNQVLRSIRQILNKDIDYIFLENLINKKEQFQKTPNNFEVRNNLKLVQNEIDDILYVPEYVSVYIDHNSHYDYIFNNGFYINGNKYIRLLCSASQARVNTVIFCKEDIKPSLEKILNNGRNEKPLVPSKFNAYYALSTSATQVVTKPRFCLVKDCIKVRDTLVNFITEKEIGDDEIEEDVMPIEYNLFDGMGLISYKMASVWAEDLGLDYVPAQFCVRQNFIKGMLCVFPFEEFGVKIANSYNIIDIYGNVVDVRDVDIIITESQFKLWDSFNNLEQYQTNCELNNLKWGVSKYSPKQDKDVVFTNYQSLQTIRLTDEDIVELCKPTIDWINGAIKDNPIYSILFMLGTNITPDFVRDYLENGDNNWLKALIVNNDLLNDKYIRDKIYDNIKTKIHNACLGKLIVNGNYSVIVSDPYAFCEHIFGLEVKGLLKEKEYYSHYWNNKSVSKVDSMRSPLTYYSEHNILNLINNEDCSYWYRYIYSGIVVNVNGDDVLRWADSDFDMDLLMTSDCEQLINGVYKNELPVTYKKKPIAKQEITEEKLYQADKLAFGSYIGAITNKSTSIYAMLPLFDKESKEYAELIKRLKICRKAQGNEIDKAKGLEIKEFPKHWSEYQKINEDDSDEIKAEKEFYNRILIDKKPYFFRYLYNDVKKQYKKYVTDFNNIVRGVYRCETEELILKDKTQEQIEMLDRYYKFLPVIDSDSEMNRICRYMELVFKNLKLELSKNSDFNILEILYNGDVEWDENTYKQVLNNVKEYYKEIHMYQAMSKSYGKVKYDREERAGLESHYEIFTDKLNSVCNNRLELTNYLLYIFYEVQPNKNKDILWSAFGDCIYANVKHNSNKKISIPLESNTGDIIYLGKSYELWEL